MIVGGLWALFHVYVGQRLLAHAPLALGWRALGWGVIALLALAPFAAFFAARSRRVPLTGALERGRFTAMGLSSLLIVKPTPSRAPVSRDRESTRLNTSPLRHSYALFSFQK